MKKIIYSILLLTLLSSCFSRIEKKGYAFELSDYKLLQEGVTSKESVLDIMGSPTIVSDVTNKETWLYYSEDVKKFLFYFPKITARTIFIVKFDHSDTINHLATLDLSNESKKMQFISDYTAIKGHDVGLFKSIFSNIGQITPQ